MARDGTDDPGDVGDLIRDKIEKPRISLKHKQGEASNMMAHDGELQNSSNVLNYVFHM